MTRRLLAAIAVATLAVLAATVPVAGAQEPDADALPPETDQPRSPEQEVLGILSPIANPVCGAAGASTLLVPILGGLVEDQLALDLDISVADLLLDAMGPVFVTCAELPAPDGTRCAVIDDQLVAVWPEDLAGAGLTAPNLGGNLIEALGRVLDLLDLDVLDLLAEPLSCSIPAAAESPAPPPPPPPPPAAPDAEPVAAAAPDPAPAAASPVPAASSPAPDVGGGGDDVAPTEEVASPTPAAAPTTMTMLDVVARTVPGGVVALQLLVAAALVVFLGGSWARSLLEARAGAGSAP